MHIRIPIIVTVAKLPSVVDEEHRHSLLKEDQWRVLHAIAIYTHTHTRTHAHTRRPAVLTCAVCAGEPVYRDTLSLAGVRVGGQSLAVTRGALPALTHVLHARPAQNTHIYYKIYDIIHCTRNCYEYLYFTHMI